MFRKTMTAVALIATAMPAHAQRPVADTPPQTANARNGPPPDVSAFQHCDGSKGHAGLFEALAGAVVAGSTLGLVGGLMNNGSVDNRFKGKEGVAACDLAIALEGNEFRRTELGVARTVHYIEMGDLPKALDSGRNLTNLAGSKMQDAGYRQAIGSSSALLEANILARMSRPAEAEAAALRVMDYSPYEVIALNFARRYMRLTAAISPAKRAYLDRVNRVMPETLIDSADIFANNGDYRQAAANVAAYADIAASFTEDWNGRPFYNAVRSTYLAMAGDIPAGNELADGSSKQIDHLIAGGQTAKMTETLAMADEYLAFQRIVRQLAAGDLTKARSLFAAKERWTKVPAGMVADLSARLRQDAKPGELIGGLEAEPVAIAAAGLAKNLAAIAADSKSVEALYGSMLPFTSAGVLTGAASRTWKIGDKPGFLLRNVKDVTSFEVVSAQSRVDGVGGGEVLLLHAALIAQARGKKAFAILPVRRNISYFGVRFGNIGDPGFPSDGVMMAEPTIADLSKLIPQPVSK